MATGGMLSQYLGMLQAGMDPEQITNTIEEQRALDFAKLSADQQRGYALNRGLGQGIRGIMTGLGMGPAEDPVLKQASMLRQLEKQFDLTTVDGWKQYSKALQEQGMGELARQAYAKGLELEKTGAEIESTKALTKQREREKEAKDPFQDILITGKFTLPSLAAYKRSGNVEDLQYTEAKEAQKFDTKEFADGIWSVDKTTGKRVEKLGEAPKKERSLTDAIATGIANIPAATAAALKKEGEETGKFAAADYNTLGNQVSAGIQSKRELGTLKQALPLAFTGRLSDTKASIVSTLDALGMPISEDLKKAASSTELLNAMGTRYVFPLVKKFPGSLAAKELDRLEKTAPNSLLQPATIRSLVETLEQELAENEFVFNKAKKYKQENKGTTVGFDSASTRIEYQQKLSQLKGLVASVKKAGKMTQAEKAQIDSLKNELGV